MKIYRIAERHPDRKPFMIYTLAHGVETLAGGPLWAFTSEQARMFAINKYSRLQDDLQMGYEVVAKLDKVVWEEELERREYEKNKLENFVQTAWWQD